MSAAESVRKPGSSNPNGVISNLFVKHLNPTSLFCLSASLQKLEPNQSFKNF